MKHNGTTAGSMHSRTACHIMPSSCPETQNQSFGMWNL